MADSLEDLEFNIKFPTCTSKDLFNRNVNDNKELLLYNNEQEKLPVIILFGWTGCQDKYLAKYSSIYEKKGCITLRCIAPVSVIFLRHDKFPKLGEKLLHLIYQVSLDKHPIFFHMFSNGGAFFYQHVSFQMQKKQLKLQVKGAIFDSAPGERRFYSVYKALTAILGGPSWYNVPLGFCISVFLFTVFLILAILKGIKEFKKPQTDPLVLVNEPYNWPQLFIYSKNDSLVKFQDIEKFADKRKNMGIKIEKLCFDDSPHVQHLVTHREKYINTIMKFLQNCLDSSNVTKKKLY
ncbi:conserved hypothetical protein [Pediculus humanus corporis]|uniref:Transmembrane protein 53 n=1 Tax=Pediculus humanus subsp. corporis TaxID=121224 RepID=E0VA22_PEDHC|nr:uncharacterized protein Phum_PHUM025730 [Pediculus humanus corporis]EEB10228.1 conserved hypothetical protein [Pediculus humanus corporis]